MKVGDVVRIVRMEDNGAMTESFLAVTGFTDYGGGRYVDENGACELSDGSTEPIWRCKQVL